MIRINMTISTKRRRTNTSNSNININILNGEIENADADLTSVINSAYTVNNNAIVDTTTSVTLGIDEDTNENLTFCHHRSDEDRPTRLCRAVYDYNPVTSPATNYTNGADLLNYYYGQGYRFLTLPDFSSDDLYSFEMEVYNTEFYNGNFKRLKDGVRPLLPSSSVQAVLYKPKSSYQNEESFDTSIENVLSKGYFTKSNNTLSITSDVIVHQGQYEIEANKVQVTELCKIPTSGNYSGNNGRMGCVQASQGSGSNFFQYFLLRVENDTIGSNVNVEMDV